MENKRSLSTIAVMGCTMFSRMLGFIKIALISHFFGATGKADVLNFVFDIPNNLRKLLAEGALSSAFIPTLSESLNDADKNKSKLLVRKLLTFQTILILIISILCIIFSRPIIMFLSEYSDPIKIDLASTLFKFFINYILFVSISAIIMATLNVHSKFFVSAFSPIVFSICIIISVLAFHKTLDIYSMVIGILVGGLAQVLIQLPTFYKLKYSLLLDFRFNDPYFKKIIKRWIPVLFSSSIFFINQIIANKFASGLDDGSVSALKNSIIFWQLPQGIFGASIVTVLFPLMSRQVASNDFDGLKSSIDRGLSSILVLLVPSSIILIYLGPYMISAALQHGNFTLADTKITATVLTYYSLGLFFCGAHNFLQRFFYSMHSYYIPLVISVVVVTVDIVLSLILKETYLKVNGLAVANSVSYFVAFILQLIVVYKKLKGIKLKSFFINLFKVFISSLLLIGYFYLLNKYSNNYWITGFTIKNFTLSFLAGCGSVVVVLVSFLLLKVDLIADILKRRPR